MNKALLYTLAAIADIVFAALMWRSGRAGVSLLLGVAALCFVFAAAGHALGFGKRNRR